MNKRFSTLMAVALLTGSFSMSGVASTALFAAPAVIETRAVAADAVAVTALPTDANVAAVKGMLPGFTNNSRLVAIVKDAGTYTDVVGDEFIAMDAASSEARMAAYATTDKATTASYYWTMDGSYLKDGNGLSLSIKNEQVFEVVPVKDAAGVKQPYFLLKVVGGANAGKYVTYTAAATWDLTADGTPAEIDKAALFASVEAAYNGAVAGDDLNKILGDGFELTVSKAGSTAAITGADAFKGILKAVEVPTVTNNPAKYYQLKNGDKFVALKKGTITTDVNAVGEFTLVTEAELSANAAKYQSYFHVSKVDNGGDGVVVKVGVDADAAGGANRLYISSLKTSNVLSAAALATVTDSWAYTKLAGENTVDLRTLLKGQFVKINYVKTGKETTTNKYKVGGILSVRNNTGVWAANEADYVAATSLVANAPEAQWALTYDGTKLTLTNRENTSESLDITQLRKTDKAGVYRVKGDATVDGDLITITFVEKHAKTDGYLVEAENILRNTTYYLGQSRKSEGGDINAYWAENHGTHQIGATVDKESATKWNLGLIKKGSTVNGGKNVTEIDSVLVVSKMDVWDEAKKAQTEKLDTLVILPYSFQNRGNREFVRLNDDEKLRYYICDENNLNNVYRTAWRFGLKIKPNGTYNYVALYSNYYVPNTGNVSDVNVPGENKVYQANSVDKGTWANMVPYAGDDNALMVVEPAEDPEYRKIAVEWGDTISLYRQENSAQKVYEKRDDKSVVAKDTLSFLNIDNDFQFTMNPAIFADTAYINRGTGVDANTCYQYLLVVEPKFGYHNDGCGVPGHPQEKAAIDTVYGRFLVNLIDTANIYGKTHLHNNPYINKIEANEDLAKLSFVDGYHTGDKLYIPRQNNTDTLVLDMNSPEFNVAKFAFRYVDNEKGTFKIQTQFKEYAPSKAADQRRIHQEGYLRWVNGTLVVTEDFTNGDEFNMNENETRIPTNNEGIEATELSVIAGAGFVTINNAAGKTVSISNILGQTIAKAVLTSDNATIAVPSGIVVVSVEGEAAVKAIVK